ncbi:MAG: V-type ATPase subunit [Candidatus Hadarchaeales archaeon]
MNILILLILSAAGILVFLIWFGRWVSKIMSYAFCNTVVSSRETTLLTGEKLIEFVRAPDVTNVVKQLEEIGRKITLEPDGSLDWLKTEKEMHENVCREFSEILEIIPRSTKPIIKRLLGYRAMLNLKTVILGIHDGIPKEEIVTRLLPCPTENLQRFELLASAQSIESLLEFLKGEEYYDLIVKAMDDYGRYGVVALISAVEKHYWDSLWKTVNQTKEDRKLLREIFGFWIDSINLVISLRMKRSGLSYYEIERYLILPSHELTPEMFRAVVLAEDLKSAIHAIRITAVGETLQKQLERIRDVEDVEKILKSALITKTKWMAMKNFFSICPIIVYILMKERELENLRVLLRMKSAGFTQDEINKILATEAMM